MTHPLRMRICLPAVATAIAAACLLPALAAADDVVPAQVLVRYEAGTSAADRADARADAGTRPLEGLGMPRAQLLRITDGDSVAATVRQLEAQPGVAYAEPNEILQPALLPNDPEFLAGMQWGLFNDGQTVNGTAGTPGADISATAAWNVETGNTATVVAVMDTGADLQHADLQNELWTNPTEAAGTPGVDDDGNSYVDDVNGFDFLDSDANPTDLTGHGTHVAGIALAEGDNGIGVTGVSQHAALMPLRICGTYDTGCPTSDEVAAINYAGDNGAQVLNGSIQGTQFSQLAQDALAAHPDTLYVFAAGNGGDDGIGDNNDVSPTYPCALDQTGGYTADNVICVAATDQSDDRAGFSNYGASSVDLGAPGVNILSTSSQKAFFSDDFEGGDFLTRWTNTQGPGWTTTGEAPLDSLGPGNVGVTDSPGGDYAPGTTNEVTSNAVSLDPGYSTCELDYWRAVDLGSGDSFLIEVLLDDAVGATGQPQNHTARAGSIELDEQFDAGGQVQVRLRLTSNASPASVDDGVHMDDVNLICHGSPSDNEYEFLDGTSMATPMVTGAAALLFSHAPTSSVSDVKTALLDSVDPDPDLASTTVSGGRLNVYRSLAGDLNPAGGAGSSGGGGSTSTGSSGASGYSNNQPPNTFFVRKPGRVVRTTGERARVVFRFGASEAGSTFRCELDSVEYKPCAKRFVRRLLPGRHVLKVKAVDSAGAVDPTAAVAKFRVKQVG